MISGILQVIQRTENKWLEEEENIQNHEIHLMKISKTNEKNGVK